MKAWTVIGFAALALGLAMTVQCGRQSTVPVAASDVVPPPGEVEQLPFDRPAKGEGISPSSAVIPPGARIPPGTHISIHLQSEIASATAHSGDVFQAVLIDPIVVNGRTLVDRGTSVSGRVMEARAGGSTSPGYLRLALNSISINGKTSAVQSSSHFLKGLSAPKRTTPVNQVKDTAAQDVTVGSDLRLTFRLIEPVPLSD